MKKKICLLILLIFSGFVFFRGWTQILVKPDSCGIVSSKITGINKNPVVPGKFSWNWEFLIPFNAQLKSFDVKPFNTEKTISGSIASGDAFSSGDLLGYSFTYSLTLSYTPESIVNLLSNNYISSQEDFELYLSNAADYICQKATNYYIQKYENSSFTKPESIKRDELIKAINYYSDFPDLDIVIISLKNYKLPNTILYNKLLTESLVIPKVDETK